MIDWWRRYHVVATCMALLAVAAILASMIGLRLWALALDYGWGSAGLLESVRLLRGMPVYEDWRTGHPMWMYGPGNIWLFAGVFAVTGPSVWVAVALSLLVTAASIALCSGILRSRLSGWWLASATLSFALIEGKVMVFGSIRPDSFALLYAIIGLCLCYRRGVLPTVLGGLLIVAATLTKQTMLASAAIPLFALVLAGRLPNVRQLFIALIPLAMVAIAFLVMRSDPLWWYYFVEVPGQYSSQINYRDFMFLAVGHFIAAIPLWTSAIFLFWKKIEQPAGWWRLLRWSLASSLVSTLVGALAYAKFGGAVNSLMPAWFALVLLCWVVMIPVLNAAETWDRGWIVRSGLLLAMLLFMLPRTSEVTWPIDLVRGGARQSYLELRQRVSVLPGTVMSPGEVMVTFLGRGQLDRSLWLDLDILKWPTSLPEPLLKAHYSATHIVINDSRQIGYLRLRDRGYEETWANRRYRIWSRTGAGTR